MVVWCWRRHASDSSHTDAAVLTTLSDCLVPVNASTLFDGQRQQSLRALLQAIVIRLAEFVLHDADGDGRSGNPEQRHASRQPEGEAEGD